MEVDGTAGAVDLVSLSGNLATLTLASAVAADETVTVGYTPPAGPGATLLRDAAGNAVAGFSGRAVTNETPAPVNTAPTGLPAISGTARVGETLTASVTGIADADGLSSATFAYQWLSNDGATDTDIQGATGTGYTLVAADAGKTVKVRVTFTDGGGTQESLVSEATAPVAVAVAAEPAEVSIAAAASPVTEGAAAAFTLTRSGDAAAALTVAVRVSEAGAVLAGAAPAAVTFEAGASTVTLTLATLDDGAGEADAQVTAAVVPGAGYRVAAGAGTAGIDVFDNDAAPSVVTVWSADLAVADFGTDGGYGTASADGFSNVAGSAAVEMRWLWYWAPERTLYMAPARALADSAELALHLGGVAVALADGGSGNSFTWTGVDLDWTGGETVAVRLTKEGDGAVETPSGAAVSVGDAQVREAAGAVLAFRVRLNAAQTTAVSVRYATSDGTAAAGSDYVAGSGAVRFAPGATAGTVHVRVLEDAHDEGAETMTLALSRPFGAALADRTATGTIVNTDPMPKAWLARFGRTAAGHVLAAVGERLDGAAGSQMTIAGQRLSRAAAAAAYDEEAFGRGWDERLRAGRLRGEPPRSMELRALLASSSFDLAAYDEEAAAGARWTLWGRGAWTRFAGADGELTLSGDVFTGTVGADYRQDRLLAGLAVAYSTGAGTFEHSSGRGDLRTWLAGVHPYLRVALHERLAVWGVLGYGLLGHLELDEADAAAIETGAIETGVGVLMAAFGAHGTLLAAPDTGGFELAAKADGLLLRMSSEAAAGLVATEADVERWRLLLEASYRAVPLFGGVLTPSLEVGGRYDGGAAETGAGLVVGGSLRYALPAWGLTLTADGQGLLLHEAGGFSEWGAGGSLRFDPGAPDRGLALRVAPSWGRTTTGAARLWSLPDASRLAAYTPMAPAGRLDAELSYGLDAPGGHGRLTPYAGLAHSAQGERAWRLGARMSLDPSFTLSLEGTRREHAGAPAPEHAIALRVSSRW